MFLIRKIGSAELKSCIEASSNVHWVDNCLVLQPRYGSCTINFSDTSIDSCTIQFKRISGNGLFLISSGNISCEQQIISKSIQGFSHKVSNGNVKIHRTQRSKGDLAVLEIFLYKEGDAVTNWNDVLSKCDSFSCLRVVGDQLYASDGSSIHKKDVKVKTDPPDMFSIDGDCVRFLGSCRILEISIDNQVTSASLMMDSKNIPDPRLNNVLRRGSLPPIVPQVKTNPTIDVKSPEISRKTILITQNNDNITDSAIKFSRQYTSNYTANSLDIHSTIKTNTVYGRRWFDNIYPFVKSVQQSELPFSSISCISNLIPAKKMYIEEFTEELQSSDIKTIQGADDIFVSSNTNAEALRNYVQKVKITPKYLPIVPSAHFPIVGMDYVLLWNENDDVTNYVLKSIPSNIRVVLLGARGKYSDNVFAINEYLPYQNMMSVFDNAKCYIDIPLVEDRVSEYVDLSLACGTPVITTSWAYMDTKSVIFTPGKECIGKRYVPNATDLVDSIFSAKRFEPTRLEHQQMFEKFAYTLLT